MWQFGGQGACGQSHQPVLLQCLAKLGVHLALEVHNGVFSLEGEAASKMFNIWWMSHLRTNMTC